MRKTRARRVVLLVGVNLLATLVLIEGVALAGYYWQTGKLYYLDPPRGRQAASTIQASVDGFRIHPFFGFTSTPATASGEVATGTGRGTGHNNFGFESPVDYPAAKRREDEILVGLFGGSVASKLAVSEQESGAFRRTLAARLGTDASRIRLLNFSQGGFKQPQQALILSYLRSLGQELELAINCDGFNEVALGGMNAEAGIAVDMPSFDHVRALQDVVGFSGSASGLEQMLEVRSRWARYARTFNRAWAGRAPELKLASGFLGHWILYEVQLRRYHAARQAQPPAVATTGEEGGSWLHLRRQPPMAAEDAAREAAELWSRSSRLMHNAQAAFGAAYLHVLQPNQYLDTGRVFSAAESSIAFSRQSRYPPFVRSGYPRLLRESEDLIAGGVAFHDLTRIFDPVADPVYVDDCCHYNDLGEHLMLVALAELSADVLDSDGRPRAPSR